MTVPPRIYNIPAGAPFADRLAAGVLRQAGGDTAQLADITILLPSRRACRVLAEAFLRQTGGSATLLPVLRPIGDVDAEDVAFALAGTETEAEHIPESLSAIERQIVLARAVQKTDPALSFDQASAHALELGRFLDEVQTEGLSFDRLETLVPEAFAEHWQKTLTFLKILTAHWPEILRARGAIDAADRRNRLLAEQARAWRDNPPAAPIIAAGSTGTVPAAAALLVQVARLPRGQLVLPGLDTDMDDATWEKIGEGHPQWNLKKLLERAEVGRGGVKPWDDSPETATQNARRRWLSEALRPAETTEHWRRLAPGAMDARALEGLTRIDCATAEEEAGVIALRMRETLETPGKTCALITPDRRLARRVAQTLRRWGIAVNDSGGQPLSERPVGQWLLLSADAAASGLAPVPLLAMLKHPFSALDRHAVARLDAEALRGPRPAGGVAGLRARCAEQPSLQHLLDQLDNAIGAFAALMAEDAARPFKALLSAHLDAAEALAATQDAAGDARLWRGPAGEAATALLAELLRMGDEVPPLTPAQYLSFLRLMFKGAAVRGTFGLHPRLSILGQIEARLCSADLIILGGLNEGTWPETAREDPWMSRPMRRAFGLPSQMRAISLDAHDFVQGASAPEVILTRARKLDGAPTVPARFLLRMDAVLKTAFPGWDTAAGERWRQHHRRMDAPAAVRAAPRPAPCPPVAARPRALSVTQVETWMRDPYQIYARHILNLRVLEALDADPGGPERGTFIHRALERFVRAWPTQLPKNAMAELTALARAAIAEMNIPPEVEAFWWPRFEKIAAHILAEERSWRQEAVAVALEAKGRLTFAAKDADFTLRGTADRIDRRADGAYVLIDYKSGALPTQDDVAQGRAPQLPLEAWMLGEGAFPDLPAGATSALAYWHVSGSAAAPVRRVMVADGIKEVETQSAAAAEGLRRLIETFDRADTPYISRPRPDKTLRASDYDHLARLREWGFADDDAEDAA